jgi:N-glycosylase/DNA lyase
MNVDISTFIPYKLANLEELNLDVCLESGQTFSWIRHADKYWVNVFEDELLILSSQDGKVFYWTVAERKESILTILQRYFRLDVNLSALYEEWSRDAYFASLCYKCPGVRLLDQPPFEALLSFICSQNNGIKRIMSMVRVLKEHFGKLHSILGCTSVFTFPTPSDLESSAITEILRLKGFGYRARYIQAVSERITSGNLDLQALREASYEVSFEKLNEIVGVGPKVADCIALTGLAQMMAVPIDTHIWKVARTHYGSMPSGQTLTLKVYKTIGDRFRNIFGSKAGWAHLVLFAVQIRSKKC